MADQVQAGNTAKGVNDVVRDPIAEIFLFRIAALIVERKNGHRLGIQWLGADFTLADISRHR